MADQGQCWQVSGNRSTSQISAIVIADLQLRQTMAAVQRYSLCSVMLIEETKVWSISCDILKTTFPFFDLSHKLLLYVGFKLICKLLHYNNYQARFDLSSR